MHVCHPGLVGLFLFIMFLSNVVFTGIVHSFCLLCFIIPSKSTGVCFVSLRAALKEEKKGHLPTHNTSTEHVPIFKHHLMTLQMMLHRDGSRYIR